MMNKSIEKKIDIVWKWMPKEQKVEKVKHEMDTSSQKILACN